MFLIQNFKVQLNLFNVLLLQFKVCLLYLQRLAIKCSTPKTYIKIKITQELLTGKFFSIFARNSKILVSCGQHPIFKICGANILTVPPNYSVHRATILTRDDTGQVDRFCKTQSKISNSLTEELRKLLFTKFLGRFTSIFNLVPLTGTIFMTWHRPSLLIFALKFGVFWTEITKVWLPSPKSP